MRTLRRVHLYLGCIFAPLLVFLAVSGAWQSFSLHKSKKDGSYVAPAILSGLSHVHEDQAPSRGADGSVPLRWYFVLAAAGFVVTVTLGVILALRTIRPAWRVWACLALGVALPIVLLFLGGS
jgi:hypothetical protein